jgi:hypothetical protein
VVLQERIIPVTNIMTNEVLTRAAHRAVRRYIFCTASHFSNFISNINLETKQEAVSECNVFHSTGLCKTLCVRMPASARREKTISHMLYTQGKEYVISANPQTNLLVLHLL